MIAVVVVTNLVFQPAPITDPAGIASDTTTIPAVRPDTAAPELTLPDPEPPVAGSADTIRVESDLYSYGFSTRGASLVSARLLDHESYAQGSENQPVELVPAGAALIRHRLQFGERVMDLSALSFQSDQAAADSA
ncbi:MAG: hypothetical protein ACREIV_15655, partial [Planctomycetaceae bacterium]